MAGPRPGEHEFLRSPPCKPPRVGNAGRSVLVGGAGFPPHPRAYQPGRGNCRDWGRRVNKGPTSRCSGRLRRAEERHPLLLAEQQKEPWNSALPRGSPEPLVHAGSTSRGLSHGRLSPESPSKQLREHVRPEAAGIRQRQR